MSYEQGLSHPEYLLKQIEVFGQERIDQTAGHEASEEIAKELLNVLTTLCYDESSETHHFINHRSLRRRDSEQPLVLVTGTHGQQMGFGGFGHMDHAVASVDYLQYRQKSKRRISPVLREHGITIPKSFVREGMFIDGDGIPSVQREVYRRNKSAVAYKLATEEEVEQALQIIADAVFYDSKVRAIETAVK